MPVTISAMSSSDNHNADADAEDATFLARFFPGARVNSGALTRTPLPKLMSRLELSSRHSFATMCTHFRALLPIGFSRYFAVASPSSAANACTPSRTVNNASSTSVLSSRRGLALELAAAAAPLVVAPLDLRSAWRFSRAMRRALLDFRERSLIWPYANAKLSSTRVFLGFFRDKFSASRTSSSTIFIISNNPSFPSSPSISNNNSSSSSSSSLSSTSSFSSSCSCSSPVRIKAAFSFRLASESFSEPCSSSSSSALRFCA
mmetsp:Transcript_3864/g.8507  ORF Transcript_3864/g.8507 Transcript_3864/m.8507 type:complete len:261 (-) Transcript_3864:158-940(-)